MILLPRHMLSQQAPLVARYLIGKILVRSDGRRGRIVETEAYTEDDPASHTYNGKTPRNSVMFEKAGLLYVYFTYGCHYCANVVTGQEGEGSAVLLRAIEPMGGIDLMQKARGREKLTDLCSGPGKLAQAFGITKDLYGADLTQKGDIYLMDDGFVGAIEATPRIGIQKAQDTPWRFILKDNLYLSKTHYALNNR